MMLKRRFDKCGAKLGHSGEVYGTRMFTGEQVGSNLDEVVWAFLKKGMKINPHKHPEKEIYLFINGKGFMEIDGEKFPVEKGEAAYIQRNAVHAIWNNEEEDLEFVLIKFKYWARKFMDLLKKLGFFPN